MVASSGVVPLATRVNLLRASRARPVATPGRPRQSSRRVDGTRVHSGGGAGLFADVRGQIVSGRSTPTRFARSRHADVEGRGDDDAHAVAADDPGPGRLRREATL